MQPAVLVGVLALAFAVGYVASVRWLWFALATLAGFGLMGALLAALWYDGRTVTGGDTVLFQGHWIDRQLSDLVALSVLPWVAGLTCGAGASHSRVSNSRAARPEH
jgi:hypothetical protein